MDCVYFRGLVTCLKIVFPSTNYTESENFLTENANKQPGLLCQMIDNFCCSVTIISFQVC